MRPMFAEKQIKTIFWRSHQKRLAKFAHHFRQVWENLGKNPLHTKKFACSYTQWRSNPLATLAIARGSTFQGAAKCSRLL